VKNNVSNLWAIAMDNYQSVPLPHQWNKLSRGLVGNANLGLSRRLTAGAAAAGRAAPDTTTIVSL